jgi:hypothetical protein
MWSTPLRQLSFVCLDVGLEEALEASAVTGTLVVDTGLVGLGEQLDGGESTDAVLLGKLLVDGGIDLSDHDVTSLGGKLLPGGGHANAVAAPWGEELDEDVLAGIIDDSVVVVGGQLDNAGGADEGKEGDDDKLLEHVGCDCVV